MNETKKQYTSELSRGFSKEEVQMVKIKSCEEILSLPSHKGNANENHIKILSHSYLHACHQEHNV
jgi:hypothetical protein